MTPERLDELIALAALGELAPADERELGEAMRADPDIDAEVRDALATAGAIQQSLEEAPPSGMRENVLAAIAATPQESVQPAQLASRRRRRVAPLVLGIAAAAVIVVGALVVSNEALAPDGYEAVLEADDAQAHSVTGDLGTLTVTYSPSEDAMVVTGDDIPTLEDDETYQLWFDIEGHMTPAGLFRPDDDGHVEQRFDVADGTGASINVTAEPSGGSESPTLPVLATSA